MNKYALLCAIHVIIKYILIPYKAKCKSTDKDFNALFKIFLDLADTYVHDNMYHTYVLFYIIFHYISECT